MAQHHPKKDVPFIGASAPWIDEQEASYDHIRREVAGFLRDRLRSRIASLNSSELATEDVVLEMRRQMAECAVDSNFVLVSDLSEGLLALLAAREDRHSL